MTILLVEDEILTRADLSDFLVQGGNRVIPAADAAGAIAQLLAHPEVDIVLTDVQMPGELDGLGLAQWVRSRYPRKKLILMSGSREKARDAATLCPGAPFLTKPFDYERLSELVADEKGRPAIA